MPLELITNRNLSEGFHVLLVYANDVTGGVFINMLLFVIWACVTFGMMFVKQRTTGEADFPACMVTGSFITAISCVLLGLINGLINIYTYAVVIVVLMISAMMFFYEKKN